MPRKISRRKFIPIAIGEAIAIGAGACVARAMHYFTEMYKYKTGVDLDTWNPIKVIRAYRNL